MAEQKIFLGPRVRRIRNELGLTQTAMASELGISPSYLNLIERNQRPLTVQLILKLSAVYQIDPQELQAGGTGTLSALKEIFADPLLSGELPGDQELVEVSDAAPNVASGVVKLYRAYREQQNRLSDLSRLMAEGGSVPLITSTQLPTDIVRQMFEERPNYYGRIDEAAEKFAVEHISHEDPANSMRIWLKTHHGIIVRVLPVKTMPNLRRRFDRHSMRLFLSARLSAFDQLCAIAIEVASLALANPIQNELELMDQKGEEAIRIARFELARYAAYALLMPYSTFAESAKRSHYDIDALAAQFNVSFEQIAYRLTNLQRADLTGIPFFMQEIDHAGNVIRRAGARGYPQSKFGGECPKQNIYSVFTHPGQSFVDCVEMPDGSRYITLSRTHDMPQAEFGEMIRRTAIMLAFPVNFLDQTIFAKHLKNADPVKVGPVCRLCERQGCLSRSAPPITRPLGLDEMVTGLSVFDFR